MDLFFQNANKKRKENTVVFKTKTKCRQPTGNKFVFLILIPLKMTNPLLPNYVRQ